MSDEITMLWSDYRDRKHTRKVNQVIDVRDFIGTPGYSLLVVAANAGRLSISEIERFLLISAREVPNVERSRSWIQRRRWLFQQPDADNTSDRDGKERRAVKIMADYPRSSIRDLVAVLKDNGITRSREWVRQHRCDGVRGE